MTDLPKFTAVVTVLVSSLRASGKRGLIASFAELRERYLAARCSAGLSRSFCTRQFRTSAT
jgi:hypothetical protein